MRKIVLALAFCASTLSADVVLDVPREISFYDPPPIRISGLEPLHPVTLRVSSADRDGEIQTSTTRFMPGSDGVVDTRTSVANGDYDGIDPMGPFWSMRGKGRNLLPLTGPVETTIEVLDGRGEKKLAGTTIARTVLPADVRVTELRRPAAKFAGRFYSRGGLEKRPAVLTLTGSLGGIDERVAPYLASHGYEVLALAYFHFEGLPDDLLEVPLEYFRDALEWLRTQPSVDSSRIAVTGTSKGAEAALLVAASYPDLVRAVVAIVPTHVVWEGFDARSRFGGDRQYASPGRSSWSIEGKPLPFVARVVSEARRKNPPPFASLDVYELALRQPVDDGAVIPVERIRGGVFLAAGGDDIVWPSLAMARAVEKRLKAKRFRFPVVLREYPLAGHQIGPRGYRVPSPPAGGTAFDTAQAGADAWTRALEFLKANLTR